MSRGALLSWLVLTLVASRVWVELLWVLPVAGPSLPQLHAMATFTVFCLVVPLRLDRLPRVLVAGVSAWILWVAAGGLRSWQSVDALDVTVRYITPMLALLAVASRFRGPWAVQRRLLRALAVASLLPLAAVVLTPLMGLPLPWRYGYHNDHNAAHSLSVLAVVWTLLALTEPRRIIRLASAVAAFVLVLATAATEVRTALGALVVFFVTLAATRWRRVGLGALVGVGSGMVTALFWRGADTSMGALGSGRLGIWHHSWAMLRELPTGTALVGVGLREHKALSPSGHHDAHNDYLALVLQLGTPALVLYLALQLWVVRAALRLWRSPIHEERMLARVVLATQAMALTANLLSNSMLARVTSGWVVWSLSGLLLARQAVHSPGQPRPKPRQTLGIGDPIPTPEPQRSPDGLPADA